MWIKLSDWTSAQVEEHGIVEEYSPSRADSSLRQIDAYTIGIENNSPEVAVRINTKRLRDALIWPSRSTEDPGVVLQQLHSSSRFTMIYDNSFGKQGNVVGGPLYCTCTPGQPGFSDLYRLAKQLASRHFDPGQQDVKGCQRMIRSQRGP